MTGWNEPDKVRLSGTDSLSAYLLELRLNPISGPICLWNVTNFLGKWGEVLGVASFAITLMKSRAPGGNDTEAGAAIPLQSPAMSLKTDELGIPSSSAMARPVRPCARSLATASR